MDVVPEVFSGPLSSFFFVKNFLKIAIKCNKMRPMFWAEKIVRPFINFAKTDVPIQRKMECLMSYFIPIYITSVQRSYYIHSYECSCNLEFILYYPN